MLSFRALISYYLILFRPIAALQVAAIKNLFHFYSSPVALGQIYYVLVLISTNHNVRYLYPEIDISRTLVFKDHLYNQVLERRKIPWGGFRRPRRERLATDICIMNMLYESSAVISVNGFLCLY